MQLDIPTDLEGRQQAAERLLQVFLESRGRYNFACDLECLLDEAVMGEPLYAEGEMEPTRR